MASRSKTILETLKTKLETMSVANGYNCDYGLVTFAFLTPEQLTFDKTISIVVGPSPYSPMMNNCVQVGDGENLDNGWIVSLNLWLKLDTQTDTTGDKMLDLELMISDVLKLHLTEGDMGLAYIVSIEPVSTDRIPFIGENTALAMFMLSITYDFDQDNT